MSQSAFHASAGNFLDSYDFDQNYRYLKKLIKDLKAENRATLKKEIFGEDDPGRALTKKQMKPRIEQKALDPAQLTFDELLTLKSKVDALIQEKHAGEIAGLRTKLSTAAAALGIPIAELFGLRAEKGEVKERKRRQPAPKYRNPDDPEQVWTGRGKPPRWLQEKLEAGHEREEFLIQQQGP